MPDTELNVEMTIDDPIEVTFSPEEVHELRVEKNEEPLFIAWLAANIGSGSRSSETDPGKFFEMSLDDDYLYICVVPGEAGFATWKKTLLFKSL